MENKFGDFTLKIPLFEGTEVLVKKGQEIKGDQVIARLRRQETVEIDLAGALKVKPAKVASFLEVGPGRKVEKGQILAQRKRLLKKKKVFSPVAGQIESLVKNQGVLKIKTGEQIVEIRSPLSAKVADLEDKFLVLQFPALVFSARATFGKSGWGNLKDFSSAGVLDLKEAEGRIALIKDLSLAVFNKLEALEAVGVVCFKMNKEVEKQAEEIGILLLGEKDFEKVRQSYAAKGSADGALAEKRAKVDVGDGRLIVAK